ncbi:MAG: type IV toxin-antitoxin system AbiEi family antitoxin domain-containing protein [Thiotrichaceae bacterium]|nr:type IV toxin-antitoxin system AbiEi family antitoxin domain-containing protein [Thiotrichaceae bacterium]
MKHQTHAQRIIQLAHQKGVIRTCDAQYAGVPNGVLTRMTEQGQLEKIMRGLYRLPTTAISEHESLMTVAAKVPQANFCLLTALQFHELTTQLPSQVWIAMPRGSHIPKFDYPPLKMIQCSEDSYSEGVEIFEYEHVKLKIYNIAKTIADCFKHRNKIGIETALEALKQARAQKRVTADELWHFAKICRVTNIMLPYLEVIG